MAAETMNVELRSAFDQFSNPLESQGTFEKCRDLCMRFSLSADALASEWDAYATNKSIDTVSVEALQGLAMDLQQKKSRKPPLKPRAQPKAKGAEARPSLSKESLKTATAAASGEMRSPTASQASQQSSQFATPSVGPSKSAAGARAASGKDFSPASYQSPLQVAGDYANRTNAGQVVARYNDKLPAMRNAPKPSAFPSGARCRIDTDPFASQADAADAAEGGNVRKKYRFMYTSLDERAAKLEEQMNELHDVLAKRYGLTSIQPVGQPSQELVTNVGRICCEASGKLNKTAVVLEGSRASSGGQRVALDLSEMRDYALFPGQIVAVRGMNSSGRRLVAQHIFSDASLPMPVSTRKRLEEFHHSPTHQGGEPLHVMVATGPFSTHADLEYQPLKDLLLVLNKQRPDAIVLVGPFVDSNHPRVKSGDMAIDYGGTTVNVSFPDLFDLKVQKNIEKALNAIAKSDGVKPKVVIVPSLDDVQHDFVYPQPPFEYSFDVPEARDVVFMSNPCTFALNEVVFSVSANDALLHMGADEISQFQSAAASGRLARLTEHCLQQRSVYPLFPPRTGAAQLDLRHRKKYALQHCSPDVLITPSKLAHFATKVKECLCVNPGQLARGGNGGTFASIVVHPKPQTMSEDDVEKERHNIADRSRVEIMRI